MTFRQNRTGLGIALSAALFCSAFTSPLLAQDPLDEPTKAEEPKPDAAPSDPPAADAPAKDAKEEAKDAPTTDQTPPPAEPDKPSEAEPTDPAEQKAVLSVGVERLQGEAYPAPRTRGINGGSLGGTMHGLQWPYLPAVGGKAALRLGLSGSVWSDGSYAYIRAGLERDHGNQKRLAMQSRGVFRASPTYSTASGWFGQGQAELVALGDQFLNTGQAAIMGFTDDLYVRVGKWNVFDITAGRFQSWEIANHYGMGLDLNTLERDGAVIQTAPIRPKPAYGLTYFWDRTDFRMGSYAVHLYSPKALGLPPGVLRVELLSQLGAGNVGFGAYQLNFRPSAILDLGFLKVKGGIEYGTAKPEDQRTELHKGAVYRNGWGVALQGVFDPYVEGGIALARGFEDVVSDQTGLRNDIASNTTTGASAFINGRIYGPLVIGVGALYSHWVNMIQDLTPTSERYGAHDFDRQLQYFAALQYSAWDMFYVKFVGAYANWKHADRSSTPFENKLMSGRLRFSVVF